MTGIEKAQSVFRKAGLAFPSIPAELSSRLREQGVWLFSTRELDASPYNLGHYVHEVETCAVGDYALLAHSGHGVNSYALQYYLVRDALRMFLHLGWGGGYMDSEASTAQVAVCFSLADALVLAAERWSVSPQGRILIVASDFYGSYWSLDGETQLGGTSPLARPEPVLRATLDYVGRP